MILWDEDKYGTVLFHSVIYNSVVYPSHDWGRNTQLERCTVGWSDRTCVAIFKIGYSAADQVHLAAQLKSARLAARARARGRSATKFSFFLKIKGALKMKIVWENLQIQIFYFINICKKKIWNWILFRILVSLKNRQNCFCSGQRKKNKFLLIKV